MNFKKKLIGFLFFIIVVLAIFFIFDKPHGFLNISKIKKDIANQKAINKELDEENKKIIDKITRLEKNDKKYTENIIRQEGDMIKEGKETIIIFKN